MTAYGELEITPFVNRIGELVLQECWWEGGERGWGWGRGRWRGMGGR